MANLHRRMSALKRRLVESLLSLATLQARVRRRDVRAPILVDNSVLLHGLDHGDPRMDHEIRYLGGISHLARLGSLKLCSSAELFAERFREPIVRLCDDGDFSIFRGIQLKCIDSFNLDLSAPESAQQRRLDECRDPLYLSLVEALGPQFKLDAYNIFTAETYGLYGFLHLDLPLADKVQQVCNEPPFSTLKAKILLPSDVAQPLGVLPIEPSLLAAVDEPDLSELEAEKYERDSAGDDVKKRAA